MNDADLIPVKIEELGNLSLDRENRLYWKGQLIHTSPIKTWMKATVAFFAFLATAGTVANAAAAWTNFIARRPAPIIVQPASCPSPQITVFPGSSAKVERNLR